MISYGQGLVQTKRPHKKSRGGCKTCKARRVKCDEARPICSQCSRRKEECIYGLPEPKRSYYKSLDYERRPATLPIRPISIAPSRGRLCDNLTDKQPHESENSFRVPCDLSLVREPLYPPPSCHDDFELRLLWIFTTTTCSSFNTSGKSSNPTDTIMRTQVVQCGFESPFLMQSIFALTALHLKELGCEVNPNRALAYRARASEGFRQALAQFDPKHHASLVVTALILTALSSQAFRERDEEDLHIIPWMVVWRGMGLLLHNWGRQRTEAAGVSKLFYRILFDTKRAVIAVPDVLRQMISSITPNDEDYPEIHTYSDILNKLGALYVGLEDGLGNKIVYQITTWLTFVPKRFIELSRQHRPRALIILAYYAMFLKLANTVWWMKGVGQRTIDDVFRCLGSSWLRELRVPLLVTTFDTPADLIPIILERTNLGGSERFSPLQSEDELHESLKLFSWVDNKGRACKIRDNITVLERQSDPEDKPTYDV